MRRSSEPAGSGCKKRTDCNDEVAAICKADPDRFAWFASLPSFVDAQGTVEAVEYALTLDPKPSGVVTMTSYSGKLLGDPDFDAVWACFNKHKLVVFVHPSSVEISPKLIAGTLPQPTIDYPCVPRLCPAEPPSERVCTAALRPALASTSSCADTSAPTPIPR